MKCNCMNCLKRDRLTRVRLMLELEQLERSRYIEHVRDRRRSALYRLIHKIRRIFGKGTTSNA